jgi:hypothetical protein
LNLVLSFIGVELCGGNMVGFKHPKRAVTVAMAKTRSLFGKEFPPPSRLVFNSSAAPSIAANTQRPPFLPSPFKRRRKRQITLAITRPRGMRSLLRVVAIQAIVVFLQLEIAFEQLVGGGVDRSVLKFLEEFQCHHASPFVGRFLPNNDTHQPP